MNAEQQVPGHSRRLFDCYGVIIELACNSSFLLDELERRLPWGHTSADREHPDRVYSLATDGSSFVLDEGPGESIRAESEDQVLRLFARRCRIFVGEMSPRFVIVHAGVVGWQGQAIVLPGRSHAGKTTLVAELVKAGADYFSDDFAPLDANGRVHPCADHLGLRVPGSPEQTPTPAEDLGARVAREPARIGLVVVVGYEPNIGWDVETISPARAVLEMLPHTLSAQRAPAAALETLSKAVSSSSAIKGCRGEASEAASEVLSLASSRRSGRPGR